MTSNCTGGFQIINTISGQTNISFIILYEVGIYDIVGCIEWKYIYINVRLMYNVNSNNNNAYLNLIIN